MRMLRPFTLVLSAALGAALAAAAAHADTTRRFGGVTVACDTDHRCTATVRSRSDAAGFVLTRAPDWRARWVVSLTLAGTPADLNRAVSLSVDNGVDITLQPSADYDAFVRPTDYYILSPPALDRLMLQIQRGHVLRFAYIDVAGAPHTESFALDGLPQALGEIDNQQGHIAGDRRAGPPSGLPPAAAEDAGAAIAEAGIPPELADLHAAGGECEAAASLSGSAAPPPVIAKLSDTATLYALPCFRAAAGTAYRLYMIEHGEIGGIHRQLFAILSARLGWTGADTLYAPRFDAATRELSADALDEAGCRLGGRWRWDDSGFRLEALERTGGCAAPAERLFPQG